MALVAAVSLAAFVVIGVMSERTLRSDIDEALNQATEGGFDMPMIGGGFAERNDGGRPQGAHPGSAVPVYCVTVTDTGVMITDENQYASMDEETMRAAVDEVLANRENKGSLSDYDLFYQVGEDAFGTRIAFADKSGYDNSLRSIILTLVVLWALLMAAMFIITLFLSRLVAHPVEKAWDDQQRFIADASHELKTPLTVILADASILRSNPQATVAEQSGWVDSISEEAGRMQRLTEDMLMLAQADAGVDLAPVMGRVDLSQRVERACLQYEAVAFENGVALQEDVKDGIVLDGDGDRLDSMLSTLLENAFKYCGAGGSVSVALSAENGTAKLAVTNTGSISPEDLPHVFDRFYRSDASRAREGSTASFGLGLSIAKSTAELHGGTVTARSEDGLTTFTVVLPLAR